jgi:type I restriction enzyme M protein
MLSPQLRQKVHSLWSLFWTAGISNPLNAIEQITYLLFIRQLENLDNDRVKQGKISIYAWPGPEDDAFEHEAQLIAENDASHTVATAKAMLREQRGFEKCRWRNIRFNASFELLNGTVFPWLRGLEAQLQKISPTNDIRLRQVTGRLSDAYFILDTNKTDTLTRAITLIDELFHHIGTRSVNADIMGDIFEHLLEEVKESGKNGQFRTPRHVIRFMVEALNPALGTTVLDPACGSGGFLLNTILHWKATHTDREVLKLEWDGTPHDVRPVWPKGMQLDLNSCFHGYDNDRTMVRIAWMNLILHDLEFPSITQLDSLSKRLTDEQSATYDHILANPPFTGSVDEGDLSTNRQRFPAGKGDKPITTKSELLFVWLILDLLKIGGRAAVIVPDGVLFGNSNAHRELRCQLLFENTLEAVISLPANMFQPYSGVKTSILIFQRAQNPQSKPAAGEPPRTQEVWFYEIQDEAYTLDQKRKERYGQENDLWDALAKFFAWKKYLAGQAESSPEKSLAALRHAATSTGYWQPQYWEERWISVDEEFLKRFPEKSSDKSHTIPIHELWRELPFKPDDSRGARQLDDHVIATQRPKLETMFQRVCSQAASALVEPSSANPDRKAMTAAAEKAARDLVTKLNRFIRDESLLDREFDQFGLNALRPLFDQMKEQAAAWAVVVPAPAPVAHIAEPNIDTAAAELQPVVKEFAKLDGYNVWRRTQDVTEQPGKLQPTKDGKEERKPVVHSWIIPTRVWAKLETWGQDPETKEEITKSTHDDKGLIRTDYLDWLRDKLRIFDRDGTVLEEHLERLDPDCLEALDFDISAGRHKPFTFDPGEHRPPAELVGELDLLHQDIRVRLSKLLGLVEGN